MTATAMAVAFIVYSCKGKLAEADSIREGEIPIQCVDDMFIVQTENSIIKLRAEAPLMERYETDTLSYELFPKGIAVYGYTEEGKLETEIVADKIELCGSRGETTVPASIEPYSPKSLAEPFPDDIGDLPPSDGMPF